MFFRIIAVKTRVLLGVFVLGMFCFGVLIYFCSFSLHKVTLKIKFLSFYFLCFFICIFVDRKYNAKVMPYLVLKKKVYTIMFFLILRFFLTFQRTSFFLSRIN